MYDRNPIEKTATSIFGMFDNMERNMWGNMNYFISMIKTDITEKDTEYLLEAELPGFKKEDIHVDVAEETLSITAERKEEESDPDVFSKVIRKERKYGTFSRSFDVSDIDTSGIKASYTDGILRLVLPKKVEIPPAVRTIELE